MSEKVAQIFYKLLYFNRRNWNGLKNIRIFSKSGGVLFHMKARKMFYN